MSTLRTNTLQDVEQSTSINVVDIASKAYADGAASTVNTQLRNDLAAPTTGGGLIGWIKAATGAVALTFKKLFDREHSVHVYQFLTDAQFEDSRLASPTMDLTVPLTAMFNHALNNLPCTVKLGKGTYQYSSLPNLARSGLSIQGEGPRESVLKFTGTGTALLLDAFADGLSTTPFAQGVNLSNLTVQGNANTTRIIDAQGIARSVWSRVNVREANSTNGFGFHFKGFMLNKVDRLTCSTDLQPMTSIPRTGLYMDEGRRATISVGNSSNNVFTNTYMEGLGIGINLFRADQNEFIGGSPESCSVYGLLTGVTSRYNSFRGVGFENPLSTADIADGGISTLFSNIYASKAIILQGRQARIDGGYFERIEVQAGAAHNSVQNVTVNHWQTGSGGFVNNGTATKYSKIYNSGTGAFIYPKASRASITVGASPFTWVNNTGMTVAVIKQSGTVTQTRMGDGSGDMWLVAAASPNTEILRPGDSIEVSYTAAPIMSYVVLNEV